LNQVIRAKLAAPAAWEWLATTRQARILHLFDHACNLVNEHGRVLSIVSEQIGAGPFHIVLKDWIAVVYPDSLEIGEWQIDMNQALRWEPRVNWERLRAHTAVWQPHIPHMQTIVQHYRTQLGLDTAVWQPLLQAGLDRLLVGIRAGDTAVIQTGVAQLAGLGPGLTPAGDDVLLGVMYGLWATRAAEVVRPSVNAIVEAACPEPAHGAVPRTTTLSAAWLRAAERGEAGAVWHELGHRLSVNGNQWEETVGRILETGHSSGADALWGFTAVVSLF
jgi:hypothetical protein